MGDEATAIRLGYRLRWGLGMFHSSVYHIRLTGREKMDGNNFGNNNYQDNTANNTYYQAPQDNGTDNKASGKQIAGLVFGILAICTSCCYGIPGVIFGIVGLVLSILGNKESKHGIGIAGLVCSIIGLLCGVAMTIYFAAIFAVVFEMIESGEFEDYMDLIEQMQRMYN